MIIDGSIFRPAIPNVDLNFECLFHVELFLMSVLSSLEKTLKAGLAPRSKRPSDLLFFESQGVELKSTPERTVFGRTNQITVFSVLIS